jgi:hypothetical protein
VRPAPTPCLTQFATQALERAARDDVLFVRTGAGAKGADVVTAVAAAHRAAGSPALRSAALWQVGVPEELEDEGVFHDDDDSPGTPSHAPQPFALMSRAGHQCASCADAMHPTEAENRARLTREARRKALRTCRRVVKEIAPLLTPGGRVHVLSPGLLPPGPPHLAEDEAATAADLEASAAGRTLALCRGVPLAEDGVLLSPDGEAVNIDAAYFDARGLKMWRFARNRHISVKLTGVDPHRRKVGRIEDAGDVQQSVLTYLKEIPVRLGACAGWPCHAVLAVLSSASSAAVTSRTEHARFHPQMLYSIMVGSFLSIFVPECVPRRRCEACSSLT